MDEGRKLWRVGGVRYCRVQTCAADGPARTRACINSSSDSNSVTVTAGARHHVKIAARGSRGARAR